MTALPIHSIPDEPLWVNVSRGRRLALIVIGMLKGVVATALSWSLRMPISIAWTTPGMALLATIGAVTGGFPAAVAAFIAVGALTGSPPGTNAWSS